VSIQPTETLAGPSKFYPVTPTRVLTDHLLAVTDSVIQSKGDQGPETWKPPYTGDWCRYATDWATIKKKWSLTVTRPEYDANASMLTGC
jgi:hypothetical protein